MATFFLQGQAGQIEAQIDEPVTATGTLHSATPKGCAFIAHPHPLYGGTMDNKVVQTIARAFTQAGWRALRFNFRGVGHSQGVYDAGEGETMDMLGLIEQVSPASQGLPIAIAGFSFGAFVATRVANTLVHAQGIEARLPSQLVLVGTATSRFNVPPLAEPLHARTLIVHGENDDTVPFASCLEWARPQNLTLTVVPQGGHFFHGQLITLKHLISKHIAYPAAVE